MHRADVSDITDDVDKVLAGQLVTLLFDQLVGDLGVEGLDAGLPVVLVHLLMHASALAGVECSVARQHEATAAIAHQEGKALVPGDLVHLLVCKDVGGSTVRGDVDPRGNERGSVEAEVVDPAQVRQNFLGLARDTPWFAMSVRP